jgi:hypothetical protein
MARIGSAKREAQDIEHEELALTLEVQRIHKIQHAYGRSIESCSKTRALEVRADLVL